MEPWQKGTLWPENILEIGMESKPSDDITSEATQGYHPLTGSASRIESPRYRCPVAGCHQTWYRHQAEAAIPQCPIHHVQMVRDSKVH